MRKRVISWLLTVVMVVSLLPTSVLADTLAADQEQQTQQEQIAPVDTENTVPAENEETQEQQEPAPETPVSRSARSGGTALALAEGTVSSAKEFAAMDASGSYTLTKDIIVTEPYASDFSGTFDGNGHTVTLAISGDSDYQALFAKLAAGAVVKNVTVEGKVTGKKCVAGIAGQATDATITGCANKADILATDRYVGGIVAESKNTSISNCYNTGTISSDRSDKGVCLGGIVGNATNNTGGGTTVTNCYSIGTISATADTSNYAAIAGWCYNSTVTNCYYLDTTASAGANGNSQTATSKTADEMKSPAFAALLGDGFMVKSGDYPALSWETPTAAVRFTIAPANATLEINGGTYTGSTTVALPAADAPYSYTVSCPGYTQQTGSVTVTDKDNPVADPANVTVTLAEDAAQWVTVTFTVTPENATLTLKDGETQVAPTEGTTYQMLKGHAYTYTAETTEEGYEPASGTVTPNENSTQTVALKKVQSIAVTKAPTKTEYYKGDAELDLTGMVLTVNYDGTNETRTIEGDYAAAGVTCEGFSTENPTDSQIVTVKYRGKTATFTIKVKDAMLFADFFTGLNGIATAQNSTSYKFEPVLLDGGYVLKSTNEKKGNTTSSLTLTFAKAAQLTFDCKTDSEKKYDGLRVDINNQQGNQFGSTGGGYSGEKQDWKEFSIAVNAGDKVTVNYRKDSSGDKGQDCIWLRNFRAEVLPTVRFDVKDAAGTAIDATVTLKKGYTGLTAGTDGSYALTVGEKYTYTVEKKGYEKVTQEFTAQEGNNTITVTLVKLPVITLKFTPDDAAVTLKQGNTTVYKESADSEKGKNVYIAAKNTDYTYTVSKFGYETKTGNITVSADVNETITLSELATRTLTFAVTPADATVTVTHPVGGTITADENGAYIVYAGETYAYTVAKADYITVSGSFTAAKNDTITVTLTYAGEGWDGTTKTAPTQDESGVYLIDTAAKLAWFADAVQNGQRDISAKLTANINLNGKTWTAIGTSSNKFAGTLDGDNYTVSGLVTTGLVGELAEGGVVENLRVNCAIVSTSSLLGGVANSSAGTIRNCMVSGSITFSSGGYNGASAIGGITGRNTGNGVISGCVSRAVVKDAYDNSTYGASASLGGIAGYAYGVVENCYFTGTLAVKKTQPNKIINQKRGGLVGELNANAELKGSYVAGEFAIADESKFGAVVGKVNSGATITNCAYLDTVAPQAAADGTTSGMTAHTADYMRSAEFAVDMGMNQDDGTLNGGFPVLPWQGGTVLSADDLRAVSQAQQSLSLRGMSAADAAKKAKADWYAENVLGLYDLENYNDKADLCEQYGIEEPGEAVTDLHDYFLTALQKHFYKELGLDAENADLLKADATGVYQLRGLTPVSGDPEEEEETAQTYTGFLTLPTSVTVPAEGSGEKTVSLTWTADNALVNTATGALTAPAGGKATVTLKATLTSGSESKVKTFTLCLWSKAAEQQQTLDDIAAVITARNAAVRPLQGVGLYNDTTDANGKGVEKAFRRLLEEMGYEDVADKAVITYTDGSAKASGFDGAAHEYITANGDVKFFDGAVQLKEAYYAGLEFKVAYGGAEKTITTRAIVGRSFDDVQAQLTEAAKTLTWEMIRGENTNEAETNTAGAWDRHAVVGGITSNLTLPYSISGRYDMQVQWAVVDVAEDSNCLYISSDKDSASGVGNIVRPVRPAEGELPEDAGKETLIARVTYTDFDDDPYIKEHITGQNGVEVYADVFFDITVAPFDIDATNEMQTALTDNYQSLLVDFVDKTTKPDLRKVDADLQMPRPYLLQQEGIMTDSYNQKVTMVSLTPDVLGFNGYHAMVYRPLPGEEAAEARYVVTITTRSSGQLLARQEFSFTIQPFTKQELDDAAAFMTAALTGDVYWDGIKNENTDKTNVTSDLYPFAEICKNENGTLEYVRGTVNMTFDGIEADDIPGWLDTEKYRCFRSSRPSVIENELLRVHQPEYNTTVTLDSVLTYTKYAQYWEKFGLNGTEETKEKYKLFEQFYKQPVSVDLRVTGLTEKDDPNENAMITVTVQVDSYNENKHSFTGTNYTFTGKASNDWTAWDAVKACLDNAKYEYTGSGAYLKSITDTKGQTLGEKDDGKSSGWMFGVTPAQGEETLPNTTLDATFIHDGDTVRLFFTNKYIPVDPDEPVDPGTEVPNFDKVYADTKKYIQNNVPAPVVASDRGEWAVLGLARAGVELSDAYIQAYYGKVVAYVQKNMGADGVLVDPESHNPTVTDNERIILALTAIGKDPANVGGKNLLTALQDRNIMQVTDTSKTDINGLVFGLLALNSGNYTQDSYWLVQAILTQRNKDGSWSSSADTKPDGDVDMTAMALQALAPYYNEGDDTTVNAAVDKALQWLSAKYKGKGYTSAESCAQVVVALSALQLNANSDSSFVKTVDGAPTSVLGDLLRYYLGEGQGFKHAASGKTADQKATEQALYAMAAYERYCRRTKALYDMTDAVCAHSFGDWQVVSPATCTADGSRQRVCTRCGAVEVQTLPAAGHKFGEWTTTKEPTCTETGTEKRTCSVCSKEETRVIAALGHTPGTEVFVDKKYHWNICEVCDEAVNKTEHTYVNGIQCVCGVRKSAEGDADTTIKRVVVSDEITFVLEDNDKLNTPDKVKAELQLQITLKNSKSNKDNTVFMDVSLLVFENNEWRPATKEDLTAGKITVLLPYPEAVAAKYGQYNFTVAHMVAMEGCGLDVGTVEFPAVTKTASGLLVTLTGLSPVAISWTKSTNHYYYNPATTPDKTDSANTADDSQMVLWLGSAVLAAAAVVVLTRKKRVSK